MDIPPPPKSVSLFLVGRGHCAPDNVFPSLFVSLSLPTPPSVCVCVCMCVCVCVYVCVCARVRACAFSSWLRLAVNTEVIIFFAHWTENKIQHRLHSSQPPPPFSYRAEPVEENEVMMFLRVFLLPFSSVATKTAVFPQNVKQAALYYSVLRISTVKGGVHPAKSTSHLDHKQRSLCEAKIKLRRPRLPWRKKQNKQKRSNQQNRRLGPPRTIMNKLLRLASFSLLLQRQAYTAGLT